jgi:hypothetical protein
MITAILPNPPYAGCQVRNRERAERDLADPVDARLAHKSV